MVETNLEFPVGDPEGRLILLHIIQPEGNNPKIRINRISL
jgi:hypothetical protein